MKFPLEGGAVALARLRPLMILLVLVFGGWWLLEALVYRSGVYCRWLAEPESNTGEVTAALMLLDADYRPGIPTVMVFGDSRVGEGFSERLAESEAPSLNFINLSVSGSKIRSWYYLLREIRRRRLSFDMALVGLSYQPLERERIANWALAPLQDLPLIGLADLPDYPRGFVSAEMQERAWQTLLFPALAMRRDTQALLRSPIQRMLAVTIHRKGWLQSVPLYGGRDTAMPQLHWPVDGPDLPALDAVAFDQRWWVIEHLQGLQTPIDSEISRANEADLAYWLSEMAKLCQASGARLLTYPLPRTPYAQRLAAPRVPAVIAQAASNAGFSMLPADLLLGLEKPEYFFDDLHANKAGRERTSVVVAAQVKRILPP